MGVKPRQAIAQKYPPRAPAPVDRRPSQAQTSAALASARRLSTGASRELPPLQLGHCDDLHYPPNQAMILATGCLGPTRLRPPLECLPKATHKIGGGHHLARPTKYFLHSESR